MDGMHVTRQVFAYAAARRGMPWDSEGDAEAVLDLAGAASPGLSWQMNVTPWAAKVILERDTLWTAAGASRLFLLRRAFASADDRDALERALERNFSTVYLLPWAAANPVVPRDTAAGWLESLLEQNTAHDMVSHVRRALDCRPDLPLPASLLARKVFRSDCSLDDIRLSIKVLLARRRAGLSGSPATILPARLRPKEASVRAGVVLAAFSAASEPLDEDLVERAFDFGDGDVLLFAIPALNALRSDILTEGPYGGRPQWLAALTRLSERLDGLSAGLSGRIRGPLADALHAACGPDPSAADVAGGLFPSGRMGQQADLDVFLGHGIPWWPMRYEQAVDNAWKRSRGLQRIRWATKRGVADASMFDGAATTVDRSFWLTWAGHSSGPDVSPRALPKQIADEGIRHQIAWGGSGRLVHDLNAAKWAGRPAPDLRHVAVADGRRDFTLGVHAALAAALDEGASALPDSYVRRVVEDASRPIAALHAVAAVA